MAMQLITPVAINPVSFTVLAENYLQPGWCAGLMKAGLRMTSRSGPFGRTIWLAKMDGHWIQFTQGRSVALRNTLRAPSTEQMQILQTMALHGVVRIK